MKTIRQSWRRAIRFVLPVILLGMALAPTRLAAQSEDGVKAAFLYNFAKLTKWPDAALGGSDKIVVGFLKADSLSETFGKAITGKNANGHDFDVKNITSAADAAGCHIVFVGDAGEAAAVIGAAGGKPVLTVGNDEGFASAGGAIAFLMDGAKVTFSLNLAPAKTSGLEIDDRLKKVAKSVTGG